MCLEENFIHASVVALFAKRNPLLNQFNTLLRRCVEGGLGEKYWAQMKHEARLRSRRKSDEVSNSVYFVFTLSHMGLPFSLSGFGCVCNTIVCIAECCHKHFNK